MSARFTLTMAGAVVTLGGAAAVTAALVGTAGATGAPDKPTIGDASATSLVLGTTGTTGTTGTNTFTFSATIADNSGIKNVKVLAWPHSSRVTPRATDMPYVDNASCKASSPTTSVCTYRLTVHAQDAASTPTGPWSVAVQVTAQDHDTSFIPEAAHFTVERRHS